MSENLKTLRDIGWHAWDPIGLMQHNGPPPEAVDEYDSYLLEAVEMLQLGKSLQAVITMLMDIESEHMGLGDLPDAEERATQTVIELRAAFLTP